MISERCRKVAQKVCRDSLNRSFCLFLTNTLNEVLFLEDTRRVDGGWGTFPLILRLRSEPVCSTKNHIYVR